MARGTAPFNPEALRDIRRRRRVDGRLLSSAELARRLGTSKSRVLAYEKGTSVPEPGRIEQLAKVFGIQPRHLCTPSSDAENGIRHLRAAAGLTAAETADFLGVSRTTYRDLELFAQLPARHDGTVPHRLAAAFSVNVRTVHRALTSHPEAVRRRAELTRLLDALFARAHEEFQVAAVHADEPDLKAVAALLRRPVGMTCRLVNHEIGRLRGDLKERALARATAAYAQNRTDMDRATVRAELLSERIERAAIAAASALPRFLSEAMPSRQWRLTVRLLNGEAVPEQRALHLAEPEVWRALMHRGLVERYRTGGDSGGDLFALSAHGVSRALNEARLYACLYPRVPTPSRQARQRPYLTRGAHRWAAAPSPVHGRSGAAAIS
ncbi:helix-turn-helix domain-containing protein [Streptomyces sp. NPDC052687]|uniref:helix-turn-helix domain-containing protein n=1 Tax=Streptomyces sp. NPDC052687 TaxID=3154759 RepID=UPI0034165B5A